MNAYTVHAPLHQNEERQNKKYILIKIHVFCVRAVALWLKNSLLLKCVTMLGAFIIMLYFVLLCTLITIKFILVGVYHIIGILTISRKAL